MKGVYQKMMSGEMDLSTGRALSYLFGKNISALGLQIKYNRFLGNKDAIPFLESKKG